MNKFPFDYSDTIATKNLYMRPYREGDGPMLYAAGIRNRIHFAEFEPGNILMFLENEVQAEEIVRKIVTDWATSKHFLIGIYEKDSDAWAGQVYVGPTNWDLPEFTIGYVADVHYEGKGYIFEAVTAVIRTLFENMGAHRVRSDCHEDNIRSQRLLERCGFKREGHLRENKRNDDGSFHGDYLYGLLQQEFENR